MIQNVWVILIFKNSKKRNLWNIDKNSRWFCSLNSRSLELFTSTTESIYHNFDCICWNTISQIYKFNFYVEMRDFSSVFLFLFFHSFTDFIFIAKYSFFYTFLGSATTQTAAITEPNVFCIDFFIHFLLNHISWVIFMIVIFHKENLK